MKKFHKIVRVLMTALAFSIVFTSCGDSNSSDDDKNQLPQTEKTKEKQSGDQKISTIEYDLGLTDLSSGWDSEYDSTSKTITFSSQWAGRGWWLEKFDASSYSSVDVYFESATFDVQLVIEYSTGDQDKQYVVAGATSVSKNLDSSKKNNIKQIFIQNSEVGKLKLKKAVFIGTGTSSSEVNNPENTSEAESIYGTFVDEDLNLAITYNENKTYSIYQSDLLIEEGTFEEEDVEIDVDYWELEEDEEDDGSRAAKKSAKKTATKKTAKQKAKNVKTKAKNSGGSKGSTKSKTSSSSSSTKSKNTTTSTSVVSSSKNGTATVGKTSLTKKENKVSDKQTSRTIFVESSKKLGAPKVEVNNGIAGQTKYPTGKVAGKAGYDTSWYKYTAKCHDEYTIKVKYPPYYDYGTTREFPAGSSNCIYITSEGKMSEKRPAGRAVVDDVFVGDNEKYYLVGNFTPDSYKTGKFFTGSDDSSWPMKSGYNNMTETDSGIYSVTLYLPYNTYGFKIQAKDGSHSYLRNINKNGFVKKNQWFAVTKAEQKTDGRNFAIATGGGLYTFTLDLTESTPKMLITTDEVDDSAFEDSDLYVVGTMNEWKFDEENGLLKETLPESGIWQGTLTINDTTAESDYDHSFKITDKAWGGINEEYSADSGNQRSPYYMWQTGEKFSLIPVFKYQVARAKRVIASDLTKGTYTVVLDTTKEVPKLSITEGKGSAVIPSSYTNKFKFEFDVTLFDNAVKDDADNYKLCVQNGQRGIVNMDFTSFKVTVNGSTVSDNYIKKLFVGLNEYTDDDGNPNSNYQAMLSWLPTDATKIPKKGDTLHFVLEGTSNVNIEKLSFGIVDNTEDANWWKILSNWPELENSK